MPGTHSSNPVKMKTGYVPMTIMKFNFSAALNFPCSGSLTLELMALSVRVIH